MKRGLTGGAALVLAAVASFPLVALAQSPSASPGLGTNGTGGEQPHPAHIHSGTCATLGDVKAPLNDITAIPASVSGNNGGAAASLSPSFGTTYAEGTSEVSVTRVDLSMKQLLDKPYAINAHASAADLKTYIACGDISTGATYDPSGGTFGSNAGGGNKGGGNSGGGGNKGSGNNGGTNANANVRDLVVPLNELNGSGLSGTAFLHADGDRTWVFVELTGTYTQPTTVSGSPAPLPSTSASFGTGASFEPLPTVAASFDAGSSFGTGSGSSFGLGASPSTAP